MINTVTDGEIIREPELVAAEAARAEIMRMPPVADALVLQREPTAVLAEATKAAKALMAVMSQKPDKVMMNGEQYIENEDWLTIGHFYGVTARLVADEFVEYGGAEGWEATVELVARDGRVLGRATAMCLNDEEKWSARTKYDWLYCLGREDDHGRHEHIADAPKDQIVWEPNPQKPGKSRPRKFRVAVGETKVPLFQLRSMAQTRASSKVHASVLRFVPVLAGFKGTPAEELPDAERVSKSETKPIEYTRVELVAGNEHEKDGFPVYASVPIPGDDLPKGVVYIERVDLTDTANPNIKRALVMTSTGEQFTTVNTALMNDCENFQKVRVPVRLQTSGERLLSATRVEQAEPSAAPPSPQPEQPALPITSKDIPF